jgi:hypothetical protein
MHPINRLKLIHKTNKTKNGIPQLSLNNESNLYPIDKVTKVEDPYQGRFEFHWTVLSNCTDKCLMIE